MYIYTVVQMKGVVYKACVCSVLTYGAETWAMKAVVFLEAASHREEYA